MCIGCWEQYGSPTELPAGGAETVALIRELYARPDGGAGGPLHAVLDDWNIEDHFLQPWADDWEPGTWELAGRISEQLTAMTLEQRAAVLAAVRGLLASP